MKRYTILSTLFALLVGIALLVGSWGATSAWASEKLKVAWIMGGPISDTGWNAAHHRGILALEKAYPNEVQVTYKESVPPGPQAAQVIDSLVQAGNKAIFTASTVYARYTQSASEKYPDVKFIQFEGAVVRDNLGAFNADFPAGFYILGMAAGAASKSGTIGIVGAFPTPSNVRALNQLLLGARRVNPDASVRVVFISSWFDPPKETQAAQSLLASGADVLGMMMNSPSTGQVAERAAIPFLGRDSDQRSYAPNSYLAGVILNWAAYYVSEVGDILKGKWKAKDTMLEVKDGAVEIIYGNAYEKVDAARRKTISEMESKIKTGEFYAFVGPLYDQSGKLRVAEGEKLLPAEALHMDWFVKGVVTSTTGR